MRKLLISLALWGLSLCAYGANVTLGWSPSPSTNVIAEYKVYWGVASAAYTNAVCAGTNLTAVVTNLGYDTRYFFAATATDDQGMESDFSAEVSTVIPKPTNWVSLVVSIEMQSSLGGVWSNYVTLSEVRLTNPPAPSYYRSRISIVSTNNGIGVVPIDSSTMLFTH